MVYISPRKVRFRVTRQNQFFNPRCCCHQQGELLISSKSRVKKSPSSSGSKSNCKSAPTNIPVGLRGIREVALSAAHSTVHETLTQSKISTYTQVQAHTCFMDRMAKCLWPRASWVLPFSLSCVTTQDYDMLLVFFHPKTMILEKTRIFWVLMRLFFNAIKSHSTRTECVLDNGSEHSLQ